MGFQLTIYIDHIITVVKVIVYGPQLLLLSHLLYCFAAGIFWQVQHIAEGEFWEAPQSPYGGDEMSPPDICAKIMKVH